jgi:hypothetical protein
MTKWRIYRLPGSREVWHIDSGPDTQIFNVKTWQCAADSKSVDIGGMNVPRAWIEIYGELHLVDGIALFSGGVLDAVVVEKGKCSAAAVAD